jgi:hypothetical protein
MVDSLQQYCFGGMYPAANTGGFTVALTTDDKIAWSDFEQLKAGPQGESHG